MIVIDQLCVSALRRYSVERGFHRNLFLVTYGFYSLRLWLYHQSKLGGWLVPRPCLPRIIRLL